MTTTTDGPVTGGLDELLDPPAPNGPIGPGDGGGGSGGGAAGGGGSHAAPEAESEDDRRRLKIALAILGILLLLVAALFAWYLINRKPLSELPGIPQEAMPGYAMSMYGVTAPLGVAVTADGSRVYVTQSDGNRTTLAFDAQGNKVGELKPPVTTTGKGHIPMYVAVNPKTGQVWVTDRLASAVYVYTANGSYVREFTATRVSRTWQPLGIAFDANGNLFLTDVSTSPHRVLVFDANGALTHTVTAGDAMSFPNGIAIDAAGRIAVADSNNGRLIVFDGQGVQKASVNRGVGNGDLGLPRGVAIDDHGRIFVVDTTNQAVNVYRMSDDGSSVAFLGTFGTEGNGDGQFLYPNGIATDQHGHVYITDRANNRLQVWSF